MGGMPFLRRGAFAVAILAVVLVAFTSVGAKADPPPGYYDTVDATNATTLRATVHTVVEDHTRFPYTSSATDTWDILELADEDPNNTGNILDLYKNASYPKAGGGNSNYNREHSWPSSYGFPNDNSSNYPYTDCHALFLCDSGYNSSRSNKPYRYCSPTCTERVTDVNNGQGGGSGVYPGNSNWTEGSNETGTWECWIDRRGDVARAAFYMDVRYEGGLHGVTGAVEPDLILTDDTALILADAGNNQSVAYMGILSILYQWHLEDPVDAQEQARNDVIFSFQGNRNPFVDHPEWADCLFGGGACGTTGGGQPFINEIHYDNVSGDTGEMVEIAGPAGTDLSGWIVYGYNGNGGGTYASVALSGVIADQGGCMGTLSFSFSGMQNGAPDGLALVDDTGAVVEFLSYEGAFTATGGPAVNLTSTDIGVAESGSTPVGFSLQRVGTGSSAADFTWQAPAADSPGAPNSGQTFDACDTTPPAAPGGILATASDGQVDIDWNDNGEPDLAGYNLFRSTTSGGPYSILNGTLLTTSDYSDTSVTNGTTYYYVATAVDLVGNESADSSEASATPSGGGSGGGGGDPWINELHYDNTSGDTGEFVEVAGPAGTDLSGWTLVGYNGSGGGTYNTINLSGTLADQGGCIGTLSFAFTGLQNGAPDGVALVDDAGTVIEFLSYEGSLTATNGPASGMASTDIGVAESGSTPIGFSLQRVGTGSAGPDFTWQAPAADSPGAPNAGQTFDGCGGGGDTTPPAAPTSLTATPGDAIVDLDWADNGEPDLDGYSVYRATSSGGPYSLVSGSLLSTSAFSDTGVTNGTTYFYVVTASDLAGNESADSGEASATPEAPGSGLAFEAGTVVAGASSVTVNLQNTYLSPVVVCTSQYAANSTPVVTRVANVTGSSFDVRLQSPGDVASISAETIHYLVVEEGAWTLPDGRALEAFTYSSTLTDENNSWGGQGLAYSNSYGSPVVLGQVMSENDADWSVFWCRGGSRGAPPTSSTLFGGKTVCEDPDVTRAVETVGVIVIEAGSGSVAGVEYRAALGADTIRGVTNSPPYNYGFSPAFSSTPAVALATQAAMDGNNGGWAQLHGASPLSATTMGLSIDEDQVADSERKHTTEQVAYLVFGATIVYSD